MNSVVNIIEQLIPFFRAAWTANVLIGVMFLLVVFFLNKNSERKKLTWIVGGVGLLMVISSGTQLLFSWL